MYVLKRAPQWLIRVLAIGVFFGCIGLQQNAFSETIEWKSVIEGVDLAEVTVTVDREGENPTAILVRIDPKLASIRVIDLSSVETREAFQAIQATQATVSSYDSSIAQAAYTFLPDVIMNGAFSSSIASPNSAGLVQIDGVIRWPLAKGKTVQTGVFCVTWKGAAEIIATDQFNPQTCNFALQAGPVVIEPGGKNGIMESEKFKLQRYERSVIAIDQDGRVVLVRTDKIHLFDLAEFLIRDENSGKLGIVGALNLSGDFDSGIIVRLSDSTKHIAGNIHSPVATAIAAFVDISESGNVVFGADMEYSYLYETFQKAVLDPDSFGAFVSSNSIRFDESFFTCLRAVSEVVEREVRKSPLACAATSGRKDFVECRQSDRAANTAIVLDSLPTTIRDDTPWLETSGGTVSRELSEPISGRFFVLLSSIFEASENTEHSVNFRALYQRLILDQYSDKSYLICN